jgi:hypothetical protein
MDNDSSEPLTPTRPPEAEPTQIEAAEDAASRATIDVAETASLRRWASALGTTDEALAGAVQAVGPRLDRIKDHLGQGGSASDQDAG